MRIRMSGILALAVYLVACGGDAATTTSVVETTTTTSAPTTTIAPTTTTEPTTTSTAAATTSTTRPIDVYYEGGQVVGPESVSFALGDEVSILVLSDVDEEIHVHGYDITVVAKAGVPAEISFSADVPGIFEVEMEGSHTLLFQLEIS